MLNSILPTQTSDSIAPQSPQMPHLQSGETHYASFVVFQVEPQGLGYKTLHNAQYWCHLTDQRLLFAASNLQVLPGAGTSGAGTAPADASFEIPLEAIAQFKVVRSLNLKPYAQIHLKFPIQPLPQTTLTVAVSAIPVSELVVPVYYSAQELVMIGKDILGEDNRFGATVKPDTADVARLQAAIASSSMPVLVDFWASDCKPCQVFEPIVDELAAQFEGQLQLIKVNAFQEVATAMAFGIDCFPTLVLFKDGNVIEKVTGVAPKIALVKLLNQHLAI